MVACVVESSFGDGTVVSANAMMKPTTPITAAMMPAKMIRRSQCRCFFFGRRVAGRRAGRRAGGRAPAGRPPVGRLGRLGGRRPLPLSLTHSLRAQ
ncbi:unannotated protein [freshwater metagenome]|uniref:Unannotated protein n=1 Tax=freshwater metagenome TaxID=449393 RepID=A0A6J6M1H9_9ZZZZ